MSYIKIENDELIYDRTRNLSGIDDFDGIEEITCPSYGSYVEFKSKDRQFITNNNYLNIMPIGINNLYANYSMRYEVESEQAQKIINFIESKQGIESIFFETDNKIYQKINGYCTDYSLSQNDVDSFDIGIAFEITESPGHFNWRSLNFLNTEEYELTYISRNKEYKKHDIAYDQRQEAVYKDQINGIYYCHQDHNSSDDPALTLEDSEYWTRDFYWQPDVGQNTNVKLDVERFGDSNGFPLRRKIKKNTATFPLNYKFSNISSKQLKSMLHFLESKGGYKRFKHRIGAVYNRPKVYVCRTWRHTWVSYDSHDLEVTFEEDPLGIVPNRSKVDSELLSSKAYEGIDLVAEVETNIPALWQQNNTNLTNLQIGLNCPDIGQSAFEGCSNLSLSNLYIPGLVSSIGDSAFDGCSGINGEIIFRSDLSYIGDYAFRGLNQVTNELNIPSSVTYIGEQAFSGCSQLSDIKMSLSLTTLGQNAFDGCINMGGNLSLPKTLSVVPYRAFNDCRNIFGDLVLLNGLTEIEAEAFKDCRKLGYTIKIPSSINILNDGVFMNCNRVRYIEIQAEVAPTINGDPFRDMDRLRFVRVPRRGTGYNTAFWNSLGDKLRKVL